MTNQLSNGEVQCINGCLRHEHKAQEEFYKSNYVYVMSIAIRYAGNREEAEEILNDSFLKIFQKIDRYDFGKSFKGWVRKIVVNTYIDHFRRKGNVSKASVCIDTVCEVPYDYSIVSKLNSDQILLLLRNLPENYRLVFVLYEIEGYTHAEISTLLQIPKGTSRSNLARAKQILRREVMALYEIKIEKYK